MLFAIVKLEERICVLFYRGLHLGVCLESKKRPLNTSITIKDNGDFF